MDGFYSGYKSKLNRKETALKIEQIRDFLITKLKLNFNTIEIQEPIICNYRSSYNTIISENNRNINFDTLYSEKIGEFFQSKHKYIRKGLSSFNIDENQGILMQCSNLWRDRKYNNTSPIFWKSIHVEVVIKEEEYTWDFLEKQIQKVYKILLDVQAFIDQNKMFINKLSSNLNLIDSNLLEEKYPKLSPSEREYQEALANQSIIVKSLGHRLLDGTFQNERMPEVDDWNLNGKLIVHHKSIQKAYSLIHFGCRVMKDKLQDQLRVSQSMELFENDFCKDIMNGRIKPSWGFEINFSRLVMFLLDKNHVAEVESSLWDDEFIHYCKDNKIEIM